MVAVGSFLPSDEGRLARSEVVDVGVVVERALAGQTSRAHTRHLEIINLIKLYCH